jgi:Ca2+-transporting ATPase
MKHGSQSKLPVHSDDPFKATDSFFYSKPGEVCCHLLKVNPETGLQTQEAETRLATLGKNELKGQPKTPIWKIFIAQMAQCLVILLLAAAIASAILQQYVECIAIFVLVLFMAVLGTYQEFQAGESLDALSALTPPKATVLRDGQQSELDSSNLVVGDIVLMEPGRTVPADCRLLTVQGLVSAEAALTGESVGVKKHSDVEAMDPELEVKVADDKKETEKNAKKDKGKEEDEKKEAKSEGVYKKNMIYMGCTVTDGRGKAIVVQTGMRTKMGEVAELMNTADETDSPLQKNLTRLGTVVAAASIAISIVVFIIGVSTGRGTSPSYPDQRIWPGRVIQMTLIAVGLTVAAVPEALPTMVTITLAMGMKRMHARQCLCRTLHATVTLAAVSVICSDKTGTLTAGAMTAVRAWVAGITWRISGIGYGLQGKFIKEGAEDTHDESGLHLLLSALATLCSNVVVQQDEKGEPTFTGNMSEKPLVVAAMKAGLTTAMLTSRYPRLAENPFDNRRKMMSVVISVAGRADPNGDMGGKAMALMSSLASAQAAAIVKGAPDNVIPKCVSILRANGETAPLEEAERKMLADLIDQMGEQSLRVLAIAVRPFNERPSSTADADVEQELVLVGLYASIDPERPEVKPAIQKAYAAGIRVVAISGDNTKTLFAICKNIGILPPDAPITKVVDCCQIRADGDRAYTLEQKVKEKNLDKAEKSKAQQELETVNSRLDKITSYVDAFGRARPADKITILRSLQRQGHIVSMTGDGVNDAPALKQANVGVAMGITGTDAAKQASAMVLLDDSFSTIVAGVEEGRMIFRNISIFIYMLLTENTAEVFFVLISISLGQQSPLDAIQLLLLNLFTDGAPAVALAVEEAGNEELMNEGPRRQNDPILTPIIYLGIFIHAPFLCFMCLLVYSLALERRTGNWLGPGITEHQQLECSTVAYLYILWAELIRAYTSRSLRDSICHLGFFTNRWMQRSVFTCGVAGTVICFIPGLNRALNFAPIDGIDATWCAVAVFLPAILEEIVKFFYRKTGFGLRPVAKRGDIKEPVELEMAPLKDE